MRPIRWLRRGAVLVGLGAAGGALIVTARHLLETPQPLRSALAGEARIDRKHGGDIYYNLAGDESADPIVLLHDFYPGASNYEYRHIFPRLAPSWRVYAPDWLGFGMSEHPALAYTGEFYANMLIGFLRDIVGRPAVVVGHGRAANIAARAAADAPDLISRLVLISPDIEAGLALDPRPTQLLARAAQRVSLGLVPYAFLSTKPLLRRLTHRRSALTGDGVAREEAVEHLYASAHQFGGQHAQLALMTGELDLPIQNVFPLLPQPVLLLSGDEDPTHPADMMEDLAVLNPHADLDVLTSAGEAVFEDQPAMFAEALLDWLTTASTRQPPHVEEKHASLEVEAPAPVADVPISPEPAPPAETMEGDATIETPETSEGPETTETSETSEPTNQPTNPPTRRAATSPAMRSRASAVSTSVKASAAKSGAAASSAKRPQQDAQQASRKTAPRAKPDTATAKKPDSRASSVVKATKGATKAATGKTKDTPARPKRTPRKQSGASGGSK